MNAVARGDEVTGRDLRTMLDEMVRSYQRPPSFATFMRTMARLERRARARRWVRRAVLAVGVLAGALASALTWRLASR
jgi:hypothetical protein